MATFFSRPFLLLPGLDLSWPQAKWSRDGQTDEKSTDDTQTDDYGSRTDDKGLPELANTDDLRTHKRLFADEKSTTPIVIKIKPITS